ncbi:unnamed protein product [uncultured bacterium]|nr:unnamed protein product [uncultured bacterium]
MARASRKKGVFANPFYVGLMVVSTLFVVTTLAYLVSPYVLEPGRRPRGAPSHDLALWLDRQGPFVLGVEFVVMMVAGVLAMLTDDWFSGPTGGR